MAPEGTGTSSADGGQVVVNVPDARAPDGGPTQGSHDGGTTQDAQPEPEASSPVEAAAPEAAAPPCAGTPMSCGSPGNCVDCMANSNGNACVAGACGCMAPRDCPVGQACSPSTHTCSPSCGGGLTCNGGCCDGNTCQDGSADDACGIGGGSCTDCTMASGGGQICMNGGMCGCPKGGDCSGGGG